MSARIITEDTVDATHYGLRLTLEIHDTSEVELNKFIELFYVAVDTLRVAGAVQVDEEGRDIPAPVLS